MRKLTAIFSTVLVILIFFSGQAFAQANKIPVFIDGKQITFDVDPIEKDGRVLVPFRAIAEALQVKVSWDAALKTVRGEKGSQIINMKVGNKTAYVNGKALKLDVPPLIIKGRVFLPLRFFSEALDCQVDWDSKIHSVRIVFGQMPLSVLGFYALGSTKSSSWEDLFETSYPNTALGNTKQISDLAFGWYSMDETGTLLTKSTTGWLRPSGYEDVIKAAGNYGLKTQMVVHLTDIGSTLTKIISSDEAIEKAVGEITSEAKLYGGVNLDLEGLGFQDDGARLEFIRGRFTKFVESLAQQLHQNNLKLTIDLHPLNGAYLGYDYSALGKTADSLIIMAYDYKMGKPEPDALVRQAVQKAIELVPSEKVILGISVPNETAVSLAEKIKIAKQYKLGGIALWRLGLVSDEMWGVIKDNVQAIK